MIVFRGQNERFYLDDRAGQLWRGSQGRERVHLPRKQWELLRHFAKNPGKLLSKADLQDNIWGVNNTQVSEASVSRAVSDLRRSLGDRAAAPIFIEVVHGRGYRFAATIDNEEAGASGEALSVQPGSPFGGESSDPKEGLSHPELRPLNNDIGSDHIRRKRQRQPDKYAADRMSESIKARLMGPFPTARPVVYKALERCVRANAKLSLYALVKSAVQSAKRYWVNLLNHGLRSASLLKSSSYSLVRRSTNTENPCQTLGAAKP
jgi:DNA-binding winged helix-turn-helix (wHTH) protein